MVLAGPHRAEIDLGNIAPFVNPSLIPQINIGSKSAFVRLGGTMPGSCRLSIPAGYLAQRPTGDGIDGKRGQG